MHWSDVRIRHVVWWTDTKYSQFTFISLTLLLTEFRPNSEVGGKFWKFDFFGHYRIDPIDHNPDLYSLRVLGGDFPPKIPEKWQLTNKIRVLSPKSFGSKSVRMAASILWIFSTTKRTLKLSTLPLRRFTWPPLGHSSQLNERSLLYFYKSCLSII